MGTRARVTNRGLVMCGQGQPTSRWSVLKPEPVFVPFRGREVRVRHDDPSLGSYMPMATVLRSAASLASDVDGLRRVLETTIGDRYLVEVADDVERGPVAEIARGRMRERGPAASLAPTAKGRLRSATTDPEASTAGQGT